MKKHLLIVSLLISALAQATIINVPGNYPTIQSAILATVDGDTILVEPGIYYENLNFRGHNIVVTSRYYLNRDTAFIKSTIINGSQPTNSDTASCVIFNSGEDSTTVLQGFTLTGGTGTKWLDIHGAGTYREGGGVIIELCSPTVQNNLIIYNTTSSGAGVQSAGGGGMRIGDGHPLVRNNVIAFNTGRYGAGVVLNYSGVLMENNIIAYNSGGQDYGGAGVWAAGSLLNHGKLLVNNTIVNNHCTSIGGGLYINGTSLSVVNSIFWGNTASNASSSQIRLANGGTVGVAYDDIQGGWAGTGIINTDPLFTDSVSFYLPSNSPAADAGDTAAVNNDAENLSLPGNALFPSMNTLRNDMGAYGGPYVTLLPELYFMPAGIEEQKLFDSFLQVYPNPAAGYFNVEYLLIKNSAVEISFSDIAGRILFAILSKDQAGFISHSFNIKQFKSGIYFMNVKSGDASASRKIVVE